MFLIIMPSNGLNTSSFLLNSLAKSTSVVSRIKLLIILPMKVGFLLSGLPLSVSFLLSSVSSCADKLNDTNSRLLIISKTNKYFWKNRIRYFKYGQIKIVNKRPSNFLPDNFVRSFNKSVTFMIRQRANNHF